MRWQRDEIRGSRVDIDDLGPGFRRFAGVGRKLRLGRPAARLQHRHDEPPAIFVQPVQHATAPEPEKQKHNRGDQRRQTETAENFHDDMRRVLEKFRNEHGRIAEATAGKHPDQTHQPKRAPGAQLVPLRFVDPFLQLQSVVHVPMQDEGFEKGRLLFTLAHMLILFDFAIMVARSIP